MAEVHLKLKKVLALAKYGKAGERVAAQALLEKLMQKYGVTMEEIEVNQKALHFFGYKNDLEKGLLVQVVFQVTSERNCSQYVQYSRANRLRKKLGFKLTAQQIIEVDYKYGIYRADFKNEIKMFYHAFVQKNNIYGNTKPEKTDKAYDVDYLARLQAMAGAINSSKVNKLLTSEET